LIDVGTRTRYVEGTHRHSSDRASEPGPRLQRSCAPVALHRFRGHPRDGRVFWPSGDVRSRDVDENSCWLRAARQFEGPRSCFRPRFISRISPSPAFLQRWRRGSRDSSAYPRP
jgi:hypothetical protein